MNSNWGRLGVGGGFSSFSLNTGVSFHLSALLSRVSPHWASYSVSCAGGFLVNGGQSRMGRASISP